MQVLKWIALSVATVVLLWALAPSRTSPSAKSDKVVEITFLGQGGPIVGALDDVVRAFERESLAAHQKDPSKPIYKVVSGQGAAYDLTADPTRFIISVAGGMPPDVIAFDRFAIAEWAARGAFQPLDGYIEQDLKNGVPDAIRREEFYPNVWQEARYQDKLYGVPNQVDDRALVYNKDMLKRAGLVDPATGEAKPPRTWEELREYARKLTRHDSFGRIQTIGFAPNYGNSWLYMFAWMAGAQFMSPDGRKVTLDHPAIVRALQYMVDVYSDAGGYDKVMAFQAGFQGGQLDPFIVDKVAMQITGVWMMPFLSQYGRDVDFGVAPPPLPADRLAAGAKPVTWNGGWSYAIPSNALKKQAAWEFVRFATSDRGLRIFAQGEREAAEAIGWPYVPNPTPKPKLNQELFEKYVYSNPQMSERVKDGVRVYLDLLPYGKFRPITPVAQLMWTQQVSAMEEACYKRKTPKAALQYASAIVQRDLDRFLNPPQGPKVNPKGVVAFYVVLLIAVALLVYCWDTRPGFRHGIVRLFSRRRREVGVGDVIEGARGGYFRSQWLGGVLCASPWLLGFIVFGGGPLLFSIVMSFCDYDILSPPRFIGLSNYHFLFTQDELAPKAFLNTLFMLIGIPIGITGGLALALLLNLKLRNMHMFRSLFYLPAVVPAVATYMLWVWIFNPVSGPLNSLLASLGFAGKNWLQDEFWAKPSIMFMGLWGLGGGMVIWLAGLQNISDQLYEAASLDGANIWHQFRHITIPQLSPYIFFNLIMGLIAGFQIFDEAFIMTHGGPVNATLFYVYHLFNNAFRYGHMGYACALAWVLFICILGFTILQMRFARKWVYYESD